MAEDFVINTDHRVVFSYGWGTLTLADIKTHRVRMVQDARFSPDFRQILSLDDFTKIELTSSEIQLLAQESAFAPESFRAFVTASDFYYGLGRLFGAHSWALNISVFRKLNEAAEWIGIPLEVAQQGFAEIRSRHGLD
jgi:hypothetical protein